jgi:hypothetical protein
MVWFGGCRGLDSPPEAAIEATPENTPFATPVKDERLWQAGLRIRIRIRIRIGSGFNRVSGSGFGIRIRIQEGKNDPPK